MESSNSFDHIGSFLILFGVGIAELILFTLFAYGIALILFKKMKDQHYQHLTRFKTLFFEYSFRIYLLIAIFALLYKLAQAPLSDQFGFIIALVIITIIFRKLFINFAYSFIYLLNSKIRKGDSIQSGNTSGIVKQFNCLTLTVAVQEGEDYQIPYTQLVNDGFSLFKKQNFCFPVSIEIPVNQYPEVDKQQLMLLAIASAYRSTSQHPKVSLSKETNSFRVEFSTWNSNMISAAQEDYFGRLFGLKKEFQGP